MDRTKLVIDLSCSSCEDVNSPSTSMTALEPALKVDFLLFGCGFVSNECEYLKERDLDSITLSACLLI
jgi:hypothetical protein